MVKSVFNEYAESLGYYSWKHLVSYNIQNGNTKHLNYHMTKVYSLIEVINFDKNYILKKDISYN